MEYVNINEVVFTIFFSLLTEACWIFGFPISILAFAVSRAMTVIRITLMNKALNIFSLSKLFKIWEDKNTLYVLI